MLTSAFSFTRLRAQFIKEVLSVLRDPRSRMVVFVPPILQLLVFAFAATLEVRNVDIAVYDQDAGRWSHELVQRLDSARFITHVRHVDSQQQLHKLIDRGEGIDALAIPVLCRRGADSDLVLRETTAEMLTRGPGARGLAQVVEVPGCGHAPALNVPEHFALVDGFLGEAG